MRLFCDGVTSKRAMPWSCTIPCVGFQVKVFPLATTGTYLVSRFAEIVLKEATGKCLPMAAPHCAQVWPAAHPGMLIVLGIRLLERVVPVKSPPRCAVVSTVVVTLPLAVDGALERFP